SLVVQWVGLCVPNAGGLGSIPGRGARSHMHAQLGVCMPQLKAPHATTGSLHATAKKSECRN
ncbi:hypothetical protein DBR06_SOUSAS110536, partial [Sousa chinensis]